MNDSQRIIKTIIIFIFILALNISEAKSYSLNNFDSKTSEISKYLPENHELLFYSNYKNKEINKFFKTKFTKNEIKEIDIIKEGLISFLGFDIKENLKNIYDGELILSTFKQPNQKRKFLIIFKAKKEGDLNKILNKDVNYYKSNQLVEIKRPNNLNLISHIIQTNDNFIICASNKDLISDSLKAINNNKYKQTRESKFIYYKDTLNNKKLFLYTRKQFYDFLKLSANNISDINFITEFNFNKKQLILNTLSLNNSNKVLDKNDLNFAQKNDIILLSNNLNVYKKVLNYLFKDKVYKDLITDISKVINEKILIQTNSNNWVIGFKTPGNNFSINQLTSLNNFHQDKFRNDDYIYTIFSKNNLEFLDQKTIYKSEPPIFVYESDKLTFITNNLSELLNTLNTLTIRNIFNENPINIFTDDNLIIRNFSNQKYEDSLNVINSINYFTTKGFTLSLDTIESKTTQSIPEVTPSIQLKTYLNFS